MRLTAKQAAHIARTVNESAYKSTINKEYNRLIQLINDAAYDGFYNIDTISDFYKGSQAMNDIVDKLVKDDYVVVVSEMPDNKYKSTLRISWSEL